MRLKVRCVFDASVIQPQIEADLDIRFAVQDGRLAVVVSEAQLQANHALVTLAAMALSKPIGQQLAALLTTAMNQAIDDLPRHEPRLKDIKLIDVQN